MKRVPPPPNSRRVPPPPVPKMVMKTSQEKLELETVFHQNEQQINDSAKEKLPSIENKLFHINQNEPKSLNQNTNKQFTKQEVKNVQKPKTNQILSEVQNSQLISNNQQLTSNNEQVKRVQPKMSPIIRGVPPPKPRSAVSQDKKRINPPKIPLSNIITEIQPTPQKDQNPTQKLINPLTTIQNQTNQHKTQLPNQINENQTPFSEQKTNNKQNQTQKQTPNIDTNSKILNKTQQNNNQQSPVKLVPLPSIKPVNKKGPFQVKPPVKPPTIIKNIESIQTTCLNKQNQQNDLRKEEPQIIEQLEKDKPKSQSQNDVTKQSPLKAWQKIQPIYKTDEVSKTESKEQNNNERIKQNKAFDKNYKQPNQVIKNDQTEQLKEYNELEQKLRRLQQLRSKMDESSEESYSNKEDQIQQEAELQISLNHSQQQQRINDQIIIVPQMNLKSQLDEQQEKNIKNHLQQFAIGETNYEQMEINEQNHLTLPETFTIQPPQIPPQTQTQQNNLTQSYPDQQSATITPFTPQTVYESNISVEQSQRPYLPDELSISPLNSESSMSKYRQFTHDSTNNVYHADKYHSQANFDKPKTNQKSNHKDFINQNLHDAIISQKSENQLSKLKSLSSKYQHHIRIKDQSIQTLYDKNSFDNDQENSKENLHLKINLQKSQANLQKQKVKTPQNNIEELLKQFRQRKHEYLKNIENLKIKQEKFNQVEFKYRERINQMIEQVNHKNLLILKHTAGKSDINLKIDKQIQTQEL